MVKPSPIQSPVISDLSTENSVGEQHLVNKEGLLQQSPAKSPATVPSATRVALPQQSSPEGLTPELLPPAKAVIQQSSAVDAVAGQLTMLNILAQQAEAKKVIAKQLPPNGQLLRSPTSRRALIRHSHGKKAPSPHSTARNTAAHRSATSSTVAQQMTTSETLIQKRQKELHKLKTSYDSACFEMKFLFGDLLKLSREDFNSMLPCLEAIHKATSTASRRIIELESELNPTQETKKYNSEEIAEYIKKSAVLKQKRRKVDDLIAKRRTQLLEENKIFPRFATFFNEQNMPPIAGHFTVCKEWIYDVYKGSTVSWYRGEFKKQPGAFYRMKLTTPETVKWELYIYQIIQEEMHKINGIPAMLSARVFCDHGLIISEYPRYRTLKDLLIKYRIMRKKIQEIVIGLLAVDIFKILRTLHSLEIIHRILKPEYFLICSKIERKPSLEELTDGKCALLKLGDFHMAINNSDGEKYHAGINDSKVICDEEFELDEWSYEVDNFGVLTVIHELMNAHLMLPERLKYMKIARGYLPMFKANRKLFLLCMWCRIFYVCCCPGTVNWTSLLKEFAPTLVDYIGHSEEKWYRAIAKFNVQIDY